MKAAHTNKNGRAAKNNAILIDFFIIIIFLVIKIYLSDIFQNEDY
jgi:hypothetical protein